MDLGLAGATAVVNGGSKGMGRAAAECLASEGARVAVLARTKGVLIQIGHIERFNRAVRAALPHVHEPRFAADPALRLVDQGLQRLALG